MATLPPMPDVLPKHLRPFNAVDDVIASWRRVYGLRRNRHRHCTGVDETGRRCECLRGDA
jgi:hypothetical protein